MDNSHMILFGLAATALVLLPTIAKKPKKHSEGFVDRIYVGDHLAKFDGCRKACLMDQLAGMLDTNGYAACLEKCSQDKDFY